MHSEKQQIKVIISLVLAALVLGGIGYRLFWLNARYPSPQVQTYGLHESIQAGGYTIMFTDWQWEGDSRQERTGIAELTITKTTADESVLDLTNISFESGAWGSQFDAELIFDLNPDLESLLLQMNEGESKSIRFPITMIDQQFTAGQWNGIDERVFCIVLQYYPEKLQFECPIDVFNPQRRYISALSADL